MTNIRYAHCNHYHLKLGHLAIIIIVVMFAICIVFGLIQNTKMNNSKDDSQMLQSYLHYMNYLYCLYDLSLVLLVLLVFRA